jgi:hypothetical protein
MTLHTSQRLKEGKNIVCFSSLRAWIVNDKWYIDRLQYVNDENERIVKAAAKLIAS